jgi:hypothetical protein
VDDLLNSRIENKSTATKMAFLPFCSSTRSIRAAVQASSGPRILDITTSVNLGLLGKGRQHMLEDARPTLMQVISFYGNSSG